MPMLYAIIVAGGNGSRMGGTIPKQFLLLNGLPILAHTLNCFYVFHKEINLIVALPAESLADWESMVKQYNIQTPHLCVAGGVTRFQSVRNALAKIPTASGLVAVHDGVRPLVSQATIQRCFEQAKLNGTATPSLPVVDSLRQLDHNGQSHAVDRSLFYTVQTPQVFKTKILKGAYTCATHDKYTDDASLVEEMGHRIQVVEGNPENIKITTPSDLMLAEFYLLKHNILEEEN